MSLEALESIKIFGNPLVDFRDLGELILRFAINFISVYIIARLIFYPLYRRHKFLFTYFIMNTSVFLVCILLNTIKIKMGFAFGLFAVFAILRYRTEPIAIKEMTYLFVVIIVAVLNALSVKKISYAEVLFCNVIIVGIVYLLEKSWFRQRDIVKEVRYEKIDLIKPERYPELLKDLKDRTGLDIRRVDIDRINFLNDTAWLRVFYREQPTPETNSD